MALLGSMTLSKMATKMAAILDFTKNSNLSEKCESCKHILQNVIYLNILLLLVAFFAGFFTKNSNLSEKCESCKHILQNVIYLNILLLLVAFFAGFFNFFFNDKGKKTRIVI